MTDEQFLDMVKAMAQIQTTVDSMSHRLLGNGQPGAIKIIEDRISALETFKWKIVGGFAAVWTFGEAIVHYIVPSLFLKKS